MSNILKHKINIHLNVLNALMLNEITGDTQSAYIITID